jgi:hypothetical protein
MSEMQSKQSGRRVRVQAGVFYTIWYWRRGKKKGKIISEDPVYDVVDEL